MEMNFRNEGEGGYNLIWVRMGLVLAGSIGTWTLTGARNDGDSRAFWALGRALPCWIPPVRKRVVYVGGV